MAQLRIIEITTLSLFSFLFLWQWGTNGSEVTFGFFFFIGKLLVINLLKLIFVISIYQIPPPPIYWLLFLRYLSNLF